MKLASLPDSAFTLRTERLLLKPVAPNDAAALWPHSSNPAISHYMAWDTHQTIEETAAFVQSIQPRMEKRQVLHWCIWRGPDCIGLFSLIDIKGTHYANTYDQGEIGYWCAVSEQGKGYMTEAGHAVLQFTFDAAGFHKINVAHRADNPASKKLIGRLGFSLVGTRREHCRKGGIWYDECCYELLASEYKGKPHG